jgi:hypothetical protein
MLLILITLNKWKLYLNSFYLINMSDNYEIATKDTWNNIPMDILLIIEKHITCFKVLFQ